MMQAQTLFTALVLSSIYIVLFPFLMLVAFARLFALTLASLVIIRPVIRIRTIVFSVHVRSSIVNTGITNLRISSYQVRVIRRHLLVELWVLKLNVLVQGPFRPIEVNIQCLPIGFRTVFNRASVVPSDLSSSTPVPLPLLLCNVKSHA